MIVETVVPITPETPATLIDSIGRLTFEEKLFGLLNSMAGCQHISAFQFDGSKKPKALLATSPKFGLAAEKCARNYVDFFWSHDPAHRHYLADSSWSKFTFVHSAAADVDYSPYRRACYESVGITKRLSISAGGENERLTLNLYKGRHDEFSNSALTWLSISCRMLFAILRKHTEVATRPNSKSAFPDFERLLMKRFPELTDRERQVCVQALRGRTSEAIALEIGVSINTVLTYRKRAYSRLGITSQNELMRLVAFNPN